MGDKPGDGDAGREMSPVRENAWHGPAEVLRVQAAGDPPLYCRLTLRAPEVAAGAVPGQFVHVLCPALPGPDGAAGTAAGGPPPGLPFLRRPLSLHDVTPPAGTVAFLFQVKGPGTKALAGVRPGDRLDVIGPLGRGVFPLAGDRPAIIVGGGLGVAPLFFLARRLVLEGDRCDGGKVAVLIGVRGEPDLALVEPFRVFGQEVELEVATEDASPGTAPGLVTDLLETALKRAALRWARRPAIYACGPQPMLAAVRRLAEKAGAPAWFSVEERMACGVGACRGCAVAVRGSPPFRLACVDGPVFEARDLELGEDTPGGARRGGGPS